MKNCAIRTTFELISSHLDLVAAVGIFFLFRGNDLHQNISRGGDGGEGAMYVILLIRIENANRGS